MMLALRPKVAEVEVFGSFAEVLACPHADELSRASQAVLFDRLSWYESLHRHCLADAAPVIYRASDGCGSWWLFLFRSGPHAARSLSNYYSFSSGPIRYGVPHQRTLQALIRRVRCDFSTVTLYPLLDDTLIETVVTTARDAGWYAVAQERAGTYKLEVPPGGFAQYWAERPGALRTTVKRKAARYPLDIVVARQFDAALWAIYEEIYHASWKPAEGSMAFLRELAEREGAAGCLHLGVARHAGRPIAVQLWTVENGVALIHKMAHVQDSDQRSPGTLLTHAMFAHVMKLGDVRAIDFGTGDNASKRQWMDARHRTFQAALIDPRAPSAWPVLARAAISRVVHHYKRD